MRCCIHTCGVGLGARTNTGAKGLVVGWWLWRESPARGPSSMVGVGIHPTFFEFPSVDMNRSRFNSFIFTIHYEAHTLSGNVCNGVLDIVHTLSRAY